MLAAAGYYMTKMKTGDQTIKQKREQLSYFGQPNPPSLYQRLNMNNIYDRTGDFQTEQRVKGTVFDRGINQGNTLFSTVDQNGVDAVTPQSRLELQANINDMYFVDMPGQGYNGARYNWHIDARARSRPFMYAGVSELEVPSERDTATGLGDWPVAGLEHQGAPYGYGTRAAPREVYRMGPVSLNGRTWHSRLTTGGDHRQFAPNDYDDH